MRQLIMMIVITALPVANAFAWWETIVDTVETRWPDGQLREQYTTVFFGGYDRTWKEGPYRSWYQNGQLEYDGAYDNDLKAHTWTKWDSLGWKVEQVSYLAGKKHGEEITWHPNMQVRELLHFRNGDLHGLSTVRKPYWDANAGDWGLIQSRRFFVESILVATLQSEDSSHYGGLGKPRVFNDTITGVRVEVSKWDREFYVGKQVDGKKHGKWILWTAQGYKQRVDFYQNGELLEF